MMKTNPQSINSEELDEIEQRLERIKDEIDLMEQVGYDPLRIHSTVHTKANNHMLGNHPSHSVIVGDATSNFKIYTLDWEENRIRMFVGDDLNSLKTEILLRKKTGDWTQG